MVVFDGVFGGQRCVVEQAETVGFVALGVVARRSDDAHAAAALAAQNAAHDLWPSDEHKTQVSVSPNPTPYPTSKCFHITLE